MDMEVVFVHNRLHFQSLVGQVTRISRCGGVNRIRNNATTNKPFPTPKTDREGRRKIYVSN